MTPVVKLPPAAKRAAELAAALAICAGLVLLIMLSANALQSRIGVWQSVSAWLAFIRRPDIVATAVLAAVVTMAVSALQKRGRL